MGQLFPNIANSAVVEAWTEQGPQQVFRISPWLTRFVALWSLLAFFATDFPVRAATYTWNGSSDLLWTTPANWTTAGAAATVPLGSLDIGSFTLSAGTAAYLNSSTAALGLSFVGAGTVTLLGGSSGLAGSGTLSVGASGISLAAGGGALTIGDTNATALRAFNLTLSATESFINDSSSALTIANGITGTFNLTLGGTGTGVSTIAGVIGTSTGTITKQGTGTWLLSGANTFTGSLTLSAGILRATTNAAALGAGTLVVSGGSLELANDGALAFNRITGVTASAQVTSDRLTSGAGVNQTLGAPHYRSEHAHHRWRR